MKKRILLLSAASFVSLGLLALFTPASNADTPVSVPTQTTTSSVAVVGMSAAIRADQTSVVEGDAVSFTVALSNVVQAGTVTLGITVDRSAVDLTSVRGLSGWSVLAPLAWTDLDNGGSHGTIVLMYPNFISDPGPMDLVQISGTALGKPGDVTVTLADIDPTGSLNGKSAHLPVTITTATASVAVTTDKAPVYSIYDLNHDGKIDILDVTIAVSFYQDRSSDADWTTPQLSGAAPKDADVTGDNLVDLGDLVEIMANYVSSYDLYA